MKCSSSPVMYLNVNMLLNQYALVHQVLLTAAVNVIPQLRIKIHYILWSPTCVQSHVMVLLLVFLKNFRAFIIVFLTMTQVKILN